MKLNILLKQVHLEPCENDMEIDYITDDSRKCKKNTLFVCHENGEKFLQQAKQNGAVAAVVSKNTEGCITAQNTREVYSSLCREFFSRPDERLKMIAVTGTDGKTSVATAVQFILTVCGKKAGLLGTVQNFYGKTQESSLTTPDSFELYSMLNEMADKGFEYCVLEASSQGLAQKRLYPIVFDLAVLTNLSEDHLDYHGSFENYKAAKLSLFSSCKKAVINFDDMYRDEFISASSAIAVTYSKKSDSADYTAKNIRYFDERTTYELVCDCKIHRITLKTKGDFWVDNSLAAIVSAMQCGISLEECAYAMKLFCGVKGRMEVVETGRDFSVFIDYAHTAKALKTALLSLKRFCKGRLIVVFGCGGNREKEKRAQMGMQANAIADIIFITNDNPRNENAMDIADDILLGAKKGKKPVYIILDRKEAIKQALTTAKNGDIVLLAGKGHETYQIIGEEKLPFDERKIVKEILQSGCLI